MRLLLGDRKTGHKRDGVVVFTRILAVAWATFLFAGCGPRSEVEIVETGQGDHLQDRALTEQMFASMREGGVSPDQPLLWGYFFYGPKPGLERVWSELDGHGYKLVRMEELEDGSTSILHIEKVEQHSVDSLLKRNAELTAIASPHSIEYDGMDVGPP